MGVKHCVFFFGFILLAFEGFAQRSHIVRGLELNIEEIEANHIDAITAVLDDPESTVWVASYNRIYRYNGAYFEPYPLPFEFNRSSLALDRYGKIWMLYSKNGNDGNKVIILDPKANVFMPLSEYAPGLASHAEELSKAVLVYDDAYGDIWFFARENVAAHQSGFWIRWNGHRLDTLIHQAGGTLLYPDASGQYILTVHSVDSYYGKLSVGTASLPQVRENIHQEGRRAHIIGEYTPVWTKYPKTGIARRGSKEAELPGWHLVASSQAHSVWLAPDQSLHILDTNFVSLGSCRFEDVRHLLGDRVYRDSHVGPNRIWFYGINGELKGIEVQSTPFQHIFNDLEGYASVRSFWADDRNLHVSLASGELYTGYSIGEHNKVLKSRWHGSSDTKVLRSKDGRLWSCNGGISLKALNLETGVFQRISYQDTAQSRQFNYAWALHEDRNGRIWVGHRGGLSVTYGENLHYVAQDPAFDSLKHTTVYHILETDTAFWLSTDGGIYQCSLQGEVQAWYHAAHGLPKSTIYHAELDAEGRFWLSTETAGLVCWSPTKGVLATYTEKNGFNDNTVYASLLDGYGYLWSSTANGLHRLDIRTGQVQVFLEEQGITHHEFNRNAYFRSKSGKLYFGGLNGITAFDPQDFLSTEAALVPPTLVEAFVKSDYDGGWEYIDAKEGQLEIPSTVLEFKLIIGYRPAILKRKKDFQYKIEGLKEQWQSIEGHELAHRPLPFGSHTLLVRTKNLEGSWTKPLPIKIVSLKPIYLQTWFLICLLFLISGSIYAIYRWQLRQYAQREAALEQEVSRRTEKIQQQSQELKEVNETQSRFFANISHEVRTPLTLLYSPLKEMTGNIGAYSAEQLERRMQSMFSNSRVLLRLIDEILEISKLEKGQLEKVLEPCHAGTYFSDIAFRFNEEATRRQIQFHFENKLGNEVLLSLDSSKTDKVISNLLGNAFKYTEAGGSIDFEVGREQEMLSIVVRDSGAGIPEKDLPHIFERFYQVDRAKKAKGWGIGLSFAKDLAEFMGGSIQVESKIGKGSVFTLGLPYLEAASREAALQGQTTRAEDIYSPRGYSPRGYSPRGYSPRGEKILIVEDNAEMRAFIKELLQEDFFIVEAENGMAAWQLLQHAHVDADLVISDVMMPELDGFGLLERVRSSQGTISVPFLFLTALSSNKNRIKGYAAGVDDYMSKPFSPQELRIRVANLLHRFKIRKEEHAEQAATEEKEAPAEGLNKNEWEWLLALEELLREHAGNSSISMEFFADEMHVSYRQFNRKIKQLTGLTPLQYQREIKLQVAKELAETGSYTLGQIADKVGFTRSNYLGKLFFERYGKQLADV